MKTISLNKIFKDDEPLFNSLHQIMNIPYKEVRNPLLKVFCQHEQMKPLLDKHGILPLFLYYFLITHF